MLEDKNEKSKRRSRCDEAISDLEEQRMEREWRGEDGSGREDESESCSHTWRPGVRSVQLGKTRVDNYRHAV